MNDQISNLYQAILDGNMAGTKKAAWAALLSPTMPSMKITIGASRAVGLVYSLILGG